MNGQTTKTASSVLSYDPCFVCSFDWQLIYRPSQTALKQFLLLQPVLQGRFDKQIVSSSHLNV